MAVYVDDAIHRWRGSLWCHMASPDIDELHAFALRIGLKRSWFQNPDTMQGVSWPHYDTIAKRRELAISLGAIPVDRYQIQPISTIVLNRWRGVEGTDLAVDPLAFLRRINSRHLDRVAAWLDSQPDLKGGQHSSGLPEYPPLKKEIQACASLSLHRSSLEGR